MICEHGHGGDQHVTRRAPTYTSPAPALEATVKLFRCGDVVPGCAATFRAVEEDEVVRAVGEHAVRDHGVEPDASMVARVRRLVVVEAEQ